MPISDCLADEHGTLSTREWLQYVREGVDRRLNMALSRASDESQDPLWLRCRELVKHYSLRPAKRVRSALLLSSFAMASRQATLPESLWNFAAGIELLHTFMLIHDDVADRAELRRNGPALHCQLGVGPRAGDLAVVAGDYLFARAAEIMLSCGATHAADATRYYLQVCRETAAGQYLDLELARVPLAEVSLFRTIEVAVLKTARYGFVAPLVAGAKLAGASGGSLQRLDRVGRLFGLSYQFVDDLIGMFGETAASGKPCEADFLEGKRTFPVIAAYVRGEEAHKRALAELWNADTRDASQLADARSLIVAAGGRAATERVVNSAGRAASALVSALPNVFGHRAFLQQLNAELSRREY